MKKIVAFIPNLITLLNLASGVLAAMFAIDGDLGKAAIFIFIAATFDFFDGFTARLFNAYSEIGKQLDSLADVVSFGVAPGFIMFTLMEVSLFGENHHLQNIDASIYEWGLLLSALFIPLFSAYRLAKFNIDTRQTVNFLGLPTPANAILWAGLALMSGFSSNEALLQVLFAPRNLLILCIITSILLVSEIPMFSLKFSGFDFYSNWHRYVFLLTALLLILFTGIFSPTLIILLYIGMSILLYLMTINRKLSE